MSNKKGNVIYLNLCSLINEIVATYKDITSEKIDPLTKFGGHRQEDYVRFEVPRPTQLPGPKESELYYSPKDKKKEAVESTHTPPAGNHD